MSESNARYFSYGEFQNLITRYAEKSQDYLSQHPKTQRLALEIANSRLGERLQERFTVAVVGQMRAGKSTLLNALIGRRLAPVGVNETTATVNRFNYDNGGLQDIFRVHKKDGGCIDMPLTAIESFVGDQEHIGDVSQLDFFADSDFLKQAFLVDTPGTRSVIEQHEETTQGFLAEEKCEQETLRYGSRADAVLYVINPVVRVDDQKLLDMFGDKTRMPGASVYNSLAVMQKWESLEEADPLDAAEKKCVKMLPHLLGKVSAIFPVSGMLAQMVSEQPESVWHHLTELVLSTDDIAFRKLLLSERNFMTLPDYGVPLDSRQSLLNNCGWPAIKFCLKHARVRHISDANALRDAIKLASGFERLEKVLNERFFALAGLIKASTALRKTREPCQAGILSLQDLVGQAKQNQQLATQSIAILKQRTASEPELASVLAYVEQTQYAVELERQKLEGLLQGLERISHETEVNFDFLDKDVECLQKFDGIDISEEDCIELQRVFGMHGADSQERIGTQLIAQSPKDDVLDYLHQRLSYWKNKELRSGGDPRKVFRHAADCYELLLDEWEANWME